MHRWRARSIALAAVVLLVAGTATAVTLTRASAPAGPAASPTGEVAAASPDPSSAASAQAQPGLGAAPSPTPELPPIAPTPGAVTMAWNVPVLMYHHVEVPNPAGVTYPGLYVLPSTFAAQMAALSAAGWRTITARDLAEAMLTGNPVPPRTVVISFDDGYLDNWEWAVPVLDRYGFKGTFFVVGARIGIPWHMTAAQLASMSAEGHDIEDHTEDHVDLATLTLDAARREIRLAADAIEAATGVRPVALAYPYGPTSPTAERAAELEGMRLAFVTDRGMPERDAGRLDLHRLRVFGVHPLAAGGYGGDETPERLLADLAAYDYVAPTNGPLATGAGAIP